MVYISLSFISIIIYMYSRYVYDFKFVMASINFPYMSTMIAILYVVHGHL